jgi:hypothetical protein
VVPEVTDILSVSNRPVQQFDMARFNLEKPDMTENSISLKS